MSDDSKIFLTPKGCLLATLFEFGFTGTLDEADSLYAAWIESCKKQGYDLSEIMEQREVK